MENVTPRKCLIVASGVQNHKEYVDLVKERLGELLPVPEADFQREQATYIGGELRTWSETPSTQITLAFESDPWKSKDVQAFNVMNQLIGSATAFSSAGPSKGMHCRALKNLVHKHNFVDGASGINVNYSDSGLFGMSIEGPGAASQDLMNVLVEELNNLKNPIDEIELNRAKSVLKMNILLAMEKTEDRLEEIARNYQLFGDLTFHQYCDQIDAVTSDQINACASRVLSGQPTLLVSGGAINMVPSVTDVSKQLQ